MNCQEIETQIIAYLHGEITPTQKRTIQNHLAGCASCQKEVEMLSNLETRLTLHLQAQAGQVQPAPQAWNSLQTRIAQHQTASFGSKLSDFMRAASRWMPFENPATRQRALALLVILLLALAAPPTWALAARISDWAGAWFHFKTPGLESSSSVGGFKAFTPYAPQYLPQGFDSAGLGGTTAPDLDRLELTYSRKEEFVTLLQSKGSASGSLPQGKSVKVKDQAGIFVQRFADSGEELQLKIPGISIVTNFDYAETSLLAWFIEDIKFELVSNLPEAEMMKIAQSLARVEGTPGDNP